MSPTRSAPRSSGGAAIGRGARAAFLLVAWAGSPGRAQDLGDMDAPPPPVIRDAFALNESVFEMWIYGNSRTMPPSRDRFEPLLEMNLGEVDRACRLSDAQKKKLLLAGRGDIKRFQDRVADARRVFDRFKNDRTKVAMIQQVTQPLAATFRAGLFGEGSFFAKTLRTTLDPEQASLYREAVREKERFRYRAKVSLAVANLDAAAGFTADQRRRLIELMLDETSPALKLGGPYEASVVLLRMAKLPEPKLRAILDDAQWRTLDRLLQQTRNMEPFLRANGYLDEAEPAGGIPRGAGVPVGR